MNKKIKGLLILSATIISLAGCNNTMNNIKDKTKEIGNDTKNTVNDIGNDAKNAVDEINSNTINSDGNYSDVDGNVDSNKSEKDDLKDNIEDMSEETVQTMAPINVSEIENLDNTKQGWGQGTNKNKDNQPIDAINFQKKYGNYNAFFIRDLDKKNIYLTFDEGYENGYTAPILDVLKDKGVSAVFFVTMPYVKANPDLINRMIGEGHIVGNHSVKHKSFPTISVEEGKDEVEGLHNYMKENYDYDMNLFRFPCGEFSERSLELLNKLGYKSVFWSYAYADWDPNKQMDPAQAKEKVLSAAHNGAIYLLHAVSKTNSEILSDVIDELRNQGYNISKF